MSSMWNKNLFLISLLFFFIACKKDPSLWEITNLNGNTITVLGHGGMGIHYRFPMNSLESLQECLNSGTAGTEMDVSVTKDTVMVLYHNQTLEEETTCSGSIKNKNWNELENCSYKLPYLSPAKLIRAEDLFDKIGDLNKYIYTFDCKVLMTDESEYLNLFASALIRHIEKYDLSERCLIESFNITFLKILHSKNKNLRLCLYTSDYLSGLQGAEQVNLYGLTLDADNISAEQVKQAHEHHLRITLFNLEDENDNLDAIEKNADYLQTDKVEFLVGALKE